MEGPQPPNEDAGPDAAQGEATLLQAEAATVGMLEINIRPDIGVQFFIRLTNLDNGGLTIGWRPRLEGAPTEYAMPYRSHTGKQAMGWSGSGSSMLSVSTTSERAREKLCGEQGCLHAPASSPRQGWQPRIFRPSEAMLVIHKCLPVAIHPSFLRSLSSY